jgi:hypothetical protein
MRSVNIPEPTTVAPEAEFERVVTTAAEEILRASGLGFLAVPKFGVDVAFFIRGLNGTSMKMLEFKCFAGGRPGGVGFGTPKGRGPQVELLRQPTLALETVAPVIRWALVDALLPVGSRRYALFDSVTAKAGAMGEVKHGKQNNFRVSAFRPHMTEWPEFVTLLQGFLTALSSRQ